MSISLNFSELIKKNKIVIQNTYLREIILKFNLTIYQNIHQIEEVILQNQNFSKIIIIDEYQNYFILCFNSKIILIKRNPNDETEKTILQNFLMKYSTFNQYFIQNVDISKPKSLTENNFLIEIQNFEKELDRIKICNSKIYDFNINDIWSMITRSLSGFLIKQGYENSLNNENNYDFGQINEYHEQYKNLKNKNFVEIRNLGKGRKLSSS